MLQKLVSAVGGNPHRRVLDKLAQEIARINALEAELEQLPDDALRSRTDEFRAAIRAAGQGIEDAAQRRAAEQKQMEAILPGAFSLVREASKRTIGLRHYEVQLIGGIVLHRGQIAEMRTGEGKTLVATLPLYLNALAGHGAHLVTVNDYLARRDARWMAPVFQLLGLSVGVLQMAAATENGKKAFIVDFTKESPHEDQLHMRLVDRAEAYSADITYGTNSEFGFDYLRDNMGMRLADRVQRGHYFAIVDEVDNVLIDEARTPLIISGPASGDLEWYGKMAQLVRQLKSEDYEVDEKARTVSLTEVGMGRVESLLGQRLRDPDRPEDVTPEQARLTGYLEQALRAQTLFHRNKDYLVQAGKVVIVDEFTGRLMPGRRWSDGLHQAVEAKEGVRVEPENVTYATITLQNYFRMYGKLAGMTGTALTEAEEFSKIYNLEVLPIPTNLEYEAFGDQPTLVEVKKKDEQGYAYSYYSRPGTPDEPVYYRRKDYPDVIYRTLEAKLRALVLEIISMHVQGRPLLIGTTSVDLSERLSNRLRAESVRRLLQIALVRRLFIRKQAREEDGRLIPELEPFNQPLDSVTPEALRKFASGFGVSTISIEDPANVAVLLEELRIPEGAQDRLRAVVQTGIPHQVLNARKHTEESQIIAGAGAFGAVTIATNMAGRGVDIKLGGEVAEEVIAAANRVLRRLGHADPFDMPMQARREALATADPAQFGIYEGEVRLFLQYFEDMERVRELGGLHVIGSERHEARRIDNQLRGRAARQGDPGSSRFYLSLEDELMRLFGGDQVSGLMQRLKVDDTLPLEARIVSGIIENSQHRVEGANFDVRKHLLEYDDVLNKQREQIYSQRDRIFTKQDLTEDIADLLQAEVEARVEAGLVDPEGPWKLIAWLDGVQPPFDSQGVLVPSFGLSLVLAELHGKGDVRSAILDLVSRAITAEQNHVLHAISEMVDRTGEGIEAQENERVDAAEAFLEGQADSAERVPALKAAEELTSLLRTSVRFSSEQQRAYTANPKSIRDDLVQLVGGAVLTVNAARVIGAIELRIGESLGIKPDATDWDAFSDAVLSTTEKLLGQRAERLLGQLTQDMGTLMQSETGADDSSRARLLLSLAQGVRTNFDQRTHRQVRQVYNRVSYVFLAAHLLANRETEAVTDQILDHLEKAETALQIAWGQREFDRIAQNAVCIGDFGPAAAVFGPERANESLSALGGDDRNTLVNAIGSYILNEVKRQLLLSSITELWVDYLTKVEALRVSIGLEAYAQRDPLVQYKGQASELFQQLLAEVRSSVIARVFAYQPRPVEVKIAEDTSNASVAVATTEKPAKRKRHRH